MIIHSRALAALAATTLLTTLVAPLATAEADDAAPMMATAAAETIRLWPGDAPASRGTADHDIPVVAWWPAPKQAAPSAAIVVCPGGGYGALADHEGSDYARWPPADEPITPTRLGSMPSRSWSCRTRRMARETSPIITGCR